MRCSPAEVEQKQGDLYCQPASGSVVFVGYGRSFQFQVIALAAGLQCAEERRQAVVHPEFVRK